MVRPGSRGLIIGPKLELTLPWNFYVEAEALHRVVEDTETDSVSFSGATQGFVFHFKQKLTSWEFPVLGRYRLSRLPLSPFLEAGPSYRPFGGGSNISHWGPRRRRGNRAARSWPPHRARDPLYALASAWF
jgi:hypothetical protein